MTDDTRKGDAIARQIDALPRSMRLDTKAGQIVRFTGVGGSKADISDACDHLDLGQIYIVHAVEVGRGTSVVVLAEGRFNTAMFENA